MAREANATAVDIDKELLSSFRRQMQEASPLGIDHETLKVLVQLFKQRKKRMRSSFQRSSRMGRSSGARSSFQINRRSSRVLKKAAAVSTLGSFGSRSSTSRTARGAGGDDMRTAMAEAVKDANAVVNDPFSKVSIASKEEKEEDERHHLLRPLEMEDLPETLLKLEPEVLDRLNQLRTQKIEAELVLKKRYNEMNDSMNHQRYVETEAKQNKLQETALRQQLVEAQESLQRTSWDAQLMIALKQGQDEVFVKGDLSEFENPHAMLVNRAVIENENVAIRAKGADKKSVLNKIIAFRKNINLMEWEHKCIEMNASHLEHHYTDLHMLRVKRSLQEFLKGNSRDKNKKEMLQLESKLKYMQNAIKEQQKSMQRKLRRHERLLNDKYSEGQKLDIQEKSIAQRVVQLESVNRTRVSHEGNAENTQKRMKAIVTRRKLIDLARAQTDEIEILRQELDRIRQRTFPSFTHSRRAELARMGNPDELF